MKVALSFAEFLLEKESREFEEINNTVIEKEENKEDGMDDEDIISDSEEESEEKEEEELTESFSIKKHLLVIWDITKDQMKPDLLMAFTSDNPRDLDIPKGELADMIERTLKTKINTDDFEEELISTDEFNDAYGNGPNWKKMVLTKDNTYNI